MTTTFTPWASLMGGVLIGLSASGFLLLLGRVLGISGIAAGLFCGEKDGPWRSAFLMGLIAGGAGLQRFYPSAADYVVTSSRTVLIVSGLLVGIGTRLANGCTSGHGICGLARLSPRSLVATLSFMLAGIATVFLVRHMGGR